jgi:hypothetical protein
MGNKISTLSNNNNLCNYHCPVCQKTDKIPNIAGRFFILDEQFCQCNACKTVFEKTRFYKDVGGDTANVVEGIWVDK